MTASILLSLSVGQPIIALPLAEEGPRFTGGNAVWDTIPRPRRKSLTNFTGEEPWTCTIRTFLDAYPDGDVEGQVRVIEDRMHRPDDRVEPDLLRLSGPAMSAHSDLAWVLTGVDDSGPALRRSDGRRCRQELSLTFLEYVPPTLAIVQRSPAAAARVEAEPATSAPAAAPSARTYTVRSGDTLSAIAARELGNAGRWGEIATLNGIRDPRTIRAGQVVKLP